MNYKLDMNNLLDTKFVATSDKLKALEEAVTAILYMFEVGKVTITAEQYKSIADEDKKFFKPVK